jgi:hypothetical protein
MAESDYGSTLTFGGVSIGKCIVIDFPELSTDKINITNHAGAGWSEGIPSGLINTGDITLMLLLETGTLSGITADILAKTVDQVSIANNIDAMVFDGFYLSCKPEAADAQSPDALRASVVITPTGTITFNPVS